MNGTPREILLEIVTTHGVGVCDNPRRCEGLLRDYCGEYRREIFLLISALKEQVPMELLAAGATTPFAVLQARLARRLAEDLGLADDAAIWAVDSWALALGVAEPAVPPAAAAPIAGPSEPAAPARAPIPGEAWTTTTVAATGGGEYRTIGAAIAASRPYTRIIVHPGQYDETLVIDKPLEIIGDGRTGDILNQRPGDIVIRGIDCTCITVNAEYAIIRNITFGTVTSPAFTLQRLRTPREGRLALRTSALNVVHGHTNIVSCDVAGDDPGIVVAGNASHVTMSRCRLIGGPALQVLDDATATAENCDIRGEAESVVGEASAAITLRHCRVAGGPIDIQAYIEDDDDYDEDDGDDEQASQSEAATDAQLGDPNAEDTEDQPHDEPLSEVTIDGCEISGIEGFAIWIDDGVRLSMRDSRIHGCWAGIIVCGDARIQECVITQNVMKDLDPYPGQTEDEQDENRDRHSGVAVQGGYLQISGCRVNDNSGFGIFVEENGHVQITNCDLTGNARGPYRVEPGVEWQASGNKE
jgi:hypothetical protein